MLWNKEKILIVLALTLIASVANADYTFGMPTVITTDHVTAPSVSTDGLTMYADSKILGGYGDWDIFVYTRETIYDDWSEPVNIGSTINSSAADGNPDISADGLTLFFNSRRPGGQGDNDIYMITRTTKDEPWSEPENIGSVINSPYLDAHPSISSDGKSLYFTSDRPGGYGDRDIYVSTRATINDLWSEPVNLGPMVNSSSWDSGPDISNDGLTLFFDSDRPGGYGLDDIYVTTRATTEDDWGVPMNLGPIVNDDNYNITSCISADGSVLYWFSTNGRLREVSVNPVVDLDGNGLFDIDDLVIVIENWDTNEPSCDIAPAPFGNGIVDKKDLEVFMSYWNQVVDVAAYYKLDEIEGDIAYNSSGYYCDANVIGDPNWRPEGGMIDGAIELDGIDDFVLTLCYLNPDSGPFSVFAWIKGGMPNQTIISQDTGTNWLSLDPNGCLMTELKKNRGNNLLSEVVITDGDWHRVGLVWDGTNRYLYVDDEAVAQDTQSALLSSTGSLIIGAGNDLGTGTFFSGMIDDVRIYDRVITP
ncbi:MAG: PD40 domain-containing protein [Sedimentisphaerales bacterium]|nr:PD40 domain-containing protein [Sedimentisphaerales bacterium]